MKKNLLFGLALVSGTFVNAQCDITGPSPIMCESDAPVALSVESPGAEFTGPGVVDGTFNPNLAGIGTHNIDVTAPGEGYSVEEGTFDPIDISGGGAATVSLSDDQVSGALPIGFDFEFFGATFSQFYISSNGFITFTSTFDNGCCTGDPLPISSEPGNMIAFSWEDLDPGNGGAPVENLIRYETVGTAPNRILVMEFFNVDHFPNGNNVTVHTQLYETTNCIEIHTTTQPGDGGGGNHTMGIQNASGTEAYTAPGRNSSAWTATNDMYAFCPNVGCSGSLEVEVVASPEVNAMVDVEEICLGESIVLTSDGTADSYSWGIGITEGEPYTPEVTGANVFIVSGEDVDAGCIATASVEIFVHDIPLVEAGKDFSVCEDEEFTLEGSGDEGVTYTWDNGAEDGVPMMQDVGEVTYTVTGTNDGDCEATAEITVESLEVPTGTGVVFFMTGDAFDGEIDFTPEGGAGAPYTFLWSNGATTEDISALGEGEYTVTVSDGTCDSDVTFMVGSQASLDKNELVNLSVYPNPVADFVTVDYNGAYTWTIFDNAGKIVSAGNGNGIETISMENLAEGSYLVKVTADEKSSTVSIVKQ